MFPKMLIICTFLFIFYWVINKFIMFFKFCKYIFC